MARAGGAGMTLHVLVRRPAVELIRHAVRAELLGDAARDPLYKSIPFFLVLREGKAFGVLVDDTRRMTFDVGKIDPDAITFSAGDDLPVWYVIAGPTPREVLQRYTALTGRTPLPPKWALGFQ